MTQAKWVKDRIENRNFLAPNGFKLSLIKFPKVSFFCQSANIPGISIPDIVIANPFRDYSIAGTETEYEDFSVKFLIDEDMTNYATIHQWLRKTGLAENFDTNKNPIEGAGILEILNSNWRPVITIEFEDLFPISLTALEFDATDQNVEYMVAQATFKYKIYRIKNKNGDVIS
jgi:hypothetical protein